MGRVRGPARHECSPRVYGVVSGTSTSMRQMQLELKYTF
jgi:hypothetical protein